MTVPQHFIAFSKVAKYVSGNVQTGQSTLNVLKHIEYL